MTDAFEINPLTFLIKQEILLNLIKTHRAVLVLGMSGTGKTTAAIKSASVLGNIHYYSGKRFDYEQLRSLHSEIEFPEVVDDLVLVNDILILDDMHELSKDLRVKIATILKSGNYKKLIVISPFFPRVKELSFLTDIAVRFRHDTANVISFTQPQNQ